MKLAIEIPDEITVELDVAIQKFNARARDEIDAGRGAFLLPGTATDFLQRETQRCAVNFILSEHRLDLEQQAEALLEEEAGLLNKILNP
jgi:hypothetical protein